MIQQRELFGVVLAGGAARRLSGVDKPMLEVGGVPLLRRSVDALAGAARIVVVGPRRDGFDDVEWTREDPPLAGPVAALTAGLRRLGPDACATTAEVAVLAGDLAAVSASTVAKLRRARRGADGAVLVDASGHRQWLLGVWDGAALARTVPGDPAGSSLRGLLSTLSIVEVAEVAAESADVDTEEDLLAWRERS